MSRVEKRSIPLSPTQNWKQTCCSSPDDLCCISSSLFVPRTRMFWCEWRESGIWWDIWSGFCEGLWRIWICGYQSRPILKSILRALSCFRALSSVIGSGLIFHRCWAQLLQIIDKFTGIVYNITEVKSHIYHFPALGARGWRCLPMAASEWSCERGGYMLFEEGDCFQSWVGGGIFRSRILQKSFLLFF